MQNDLHDTNLLFCVPGANLQSQSIVQASRKKKKKLKKTAKARVAINFTGNVKWILRKD